MGLFNDVVCNYKPLGDTFCGVYLQSKSIDACMDKYWISPAGELFRLDYAGAFEMKESVTHKWFPFEWVPTGKHQKLSPVYYTGEFVIYPGEFKGDYANWPEAILLLKNGKVIDYSIKPSGVSQ